MNGRSFFVFDVESIGLHGEGFAVGGVMIGCDGDRKWRFVMSCPREECAGTDSDRAWVQENVPQMAVSHSGPRSMRSAFWALWMRAKEEGAIMAAECLWPVEANFVRACVADDPSARTWEGPYPFLEISSVMMAAGMDPMATYEREFEETPQHHPLADALQSARLLTTALRKLKEQKPCGS